MIVAARRDSVRLPKNTWGQSWTLAALGLVVRHVSGDMLSSANGNPSRDFRRPVSQILRCRLASAAGIHAAVL